MKISVNALLLSVVMLLLNGCDQPKNVPVAPVPSSTERESKLEDLRSAMLRLVAGRLSDVTETLKPMEEAVDRAQKDVTEFVGESTRTMSEKNDRGEEIPLESRLLHLMKNEKVNALAVRHLGTDFARDAAMFVERIRAARQKERRYTEAIKSADATYQKRIAESEKWQNATGEQREREKIRLKQELHRLEQRRRGILKDVENLTKNKMQGSKRMERERYERFSVLQHQISDMDNEITRKRHQLDSLTNPDANRQMETRASVEQLSVQGRANFERDRSLRDVERTMKPNQMVIDVVAEYEKKTMGALQKKLTEGLAAKQSELDATKAKLNKLEDAKRVIPVAMEDELMRLRKALLN